MNQDEIQVLLQDAEMNYNQAKENYLAKKRERDGLEPLLDNATATEKGARTKQISKLATETAELAHVMSMAGEEVVNLRRMMSTMTSAVRVTSGGVSDVQNDTSTQSSGTTNRSKAKLPDLPGFRDSNKKWNIQGARVFIAKFETILEANDIVSDRWVKALVTCLTYKDAEYVRTEWRDLDWETVKTKFI